jgi:hypothetical protein
LTEALDAGEDVIGMEVRCRQSIDGSKLVASGWSEVLHLQHDDFSVPFHQSSRRLRLHSRSDWQ